MEDISKSKQNKALAFSTISSGVCFAVWTLFSIIGIQIKENLGLNDSQFGLMLGTPILTGALSRIVFGIWSEQYGGRIVYVGVMLTASLATFLLTYSDTYLLTLTAALGLGLAGGSFSVGISYVSKWYPKQKQGSALGIFGIGNMGAAVTTCLAPFVLVAFGWQVVAQIWAGGLAIMAIVFWLFTDNDPNLVKR
jgi:NNP family nitrate/nitrite transporter-like MFS transporter